MSADRARTTGLTAREIAEALADAPLDEEHERTSTPRLGWGAPPIGTDTPAYSEPREDLQ